MNTPTQDSLDEQSRLAHQVYTFVVVPKLRPEDDGKFVAFDVDTGDFEVDTDESVAVDRLHVRRPGARTWLSRTEDFTAYKLRGSSLKFLT